MRLDQVGPGDTYALWFDGQAGWEILPGKHLMDLAGGELEFARGYLTGFRLRVWLAETTSNEIKLNQGLSNDDLMRKPLNLDPVLTGK